MATLVFWNCGRKALDQTLQQLCEDQDVDILLTAELLSPEPDVVRALNDAQPARPYGELFPGVSTVRIFTRMPEHSFSLIFDDGRLTIRSFRPPVGPQLLIAGLHLQSKLMADLEDQYFNVRNAINEVIAAEARVNHQNTVIIGDLNVSPYEIPVVAADGFHGMSDKKIAQKSGRSVKNKFFSFFYNPMWNHLGDETRGTPGTYYKNRGGAVINYHWNLFDQILIRSGLLPFYEPNKSVSIISVIGSKSLLSKNGTISSSFSDHLPIKLWLDLERGAR